MFSHITNHRFSGHLEAQEDWGVIGEGASVTECAMIAESPEREGSVDQIIQAWYHAENSQGKRPLCSQHAVCSSGKNRKDKQGKIDV